AGGPGAARYWGTTRPDCCRRQPGGRGGLAAYRRSVKDVDGAHRLVDGVLDDIGQRDVVQDVGDSVAHFEHDEPQLADLFVRAGAALVGHLAHTADRCDRAVEDAHHLSNRDVLGRHGQVVSAVHALP